MFGSMVTQIITLGYALQVNLIGIKPSEVNGQIYHPVYILAPYRLASVAAGSLIVYIWTIFPYPITDRSKLRKDLGTSIYALAKYYSCVHAQIVARFQLLEGDANMPSSLGSQLIKSEKELFNNVLASIRGLRTESSFATWELVGGKFPQKTFHSIIDGTESLLTHFALMS
jgi:hypothetical protein